ncbi:MAG: S-layer homology domain-containing protein [Candidatus Peregrinibacteria bacterium]|nr:S-layer homology domain-containing protein [Candidatus Peregrinibacteria bacterium]
MPTPKVLKDGFILKLFAFFFAFLSIGGSVFALKLTFESYITIENDKEVFVGETAGEQLGSTIAVGDFDHDGIQDIVMGSPFASQNDNQWNGSIKIVFGSKYKSVPERSMEFYGENSGDQLGTSITVGDFNNDHYDDIAVGAYNAKTLDNTRAGKVYLIYGGQNMHSQTSTRVGIQQPDFGYGESLTQLSGHSHGDQFGLSTFSLDVNNDGIKDLLVGAPFATERNMTKSGAVYLYFGSKQGFSANPNYIFEAQSLNERFGSSISGGHLHSQTRSDIAVGAYTANEGTKQQVGKVYIFSYSPYATYAKVSTTSISGMVDKGWFGFALEVGDINNDKFDDLAVSTFPYKGDKQDARVSIFYGSKQFPKKFADSIIDGPAGEAFLGESVLLKDLNNDGKADIAIGAPGIGDGKSNEEGSVYIIYSGQDPLKNHYTIRDHEYDTVIHGEKADDWFGSALSALDINGDGYNDLAVGSRYSDTETSVDNGKVFVMLGNGKSYGKLRSVMEPDDQRVTRGELITNVIDRLGIKKNKGELIKNCYEHKEFCFFNFLAMSNYDKIQLNPSLILYPDVLPSDTYYEDVNIATLLGLTNGFLNEKDSPFHPALPITRIEALKIVFGASELVEPKYQFELISSLGSYKNLISQKTYFTDINARVPSMWWYPRYVNFAVEHNIVDKSDYFRPNDNITAKELNDIMTRTIDYLKLKNKDEKIKP